MEFQELLRIMHKLRQSCPWDKKQTHETLKPYLIEEAYELIEAIEADDPARIKEELGDLLLQIVFHAELAGERGDFTASDVVEAIATKMVSRHPHVFGDETFETPEEVVGQWEERKKEEGKLRESILEGVPESMPALLRAHRLQSRASRVGFDWSRAEDALGKVEEELREFREAISSRDQREVEDELGDIFFALVNVSRFVGVNPEDALRRTISKFISRFRHIEMSAADAGVSLKDLTLEEMDALWDEAKDREST
jgi:tetrapyrrole methylase family protein/MazG family protein